MTVDDGAMIATSFPSFIPLMRELGATIRDLSRHDHRHRRARRIRQGNPRQPACRAFRPRSSRYRPALPGRRPRAHGPGKSRSPTSRLRPVRPRRSDSSNWRDPRLRGAAMGEAASVVSAYQPVRDALLAFQRQFAAQQSGRRARRTGHRHGGVPARGCEALHHRGPRGTGPAPPSGAPAAGREARITRRSSPTSAAATSAT